MPTSTASWQNWSDEQLKVATYLRLRKELGLPTDPLESPGAFGFTATKGRWWPARHVDYLDAKLQDLAVRRIRRLIVMEPPRHGKSELGSRWFPAWYLGMRPEERVILSMNNDEGVNNAA